MFIYTTPTITSLSHHNLTTTDKNDNNLTFVIPISTQSGEESYSVLFKISPFGRNDRFSSCHSDPDAVGRGIFVEIVFPYQDFSPDQSGSKRHFFTHRHVRQLRRT
jgi:hypothetical protein